MSQFSIKDEDSSDHLTISWLPSKRGWAEGNIKIKVGCFSGKYKAEFLLREIVALQSDLQEISGGSAENLKFQTVNGQLEFKVIGDGNGCFEAEFDAQESFGESRLIFILKFNQTQISRMIRELEQMLAPRKIEYW